jgi:hypothetical protein
MRVVAGPGRTYVRGDESVRCVALRCVPINSLLGRPSRPGCVSVRFIVILVDVLTRSIGSEASWSCSGGLHFGIGHCKPAWYEFHASKRS